MPQYRRVNDGSYFSISTNPANSTAQIDAVSVNGPIPRSQDSWVMIPSPSKSRTTKVIPPPNPSLSFRSVMWPWLRRDNQRSWITAMHYSLPSFTTVDCRFARLVSDHSFLHSPKLQTTASLEQNSSAALTSIMASLPLPFMFVLFIKTEDR